MPDDGSDWTLVGVVGAGAFCTSSLEAFGGGPVVAGATGPGTLGVGGPLATEGWDTSPFALPFAPEAVVVVPVKAEDGTAGGGIEDV